MLTATHLCASDPWLIRKEPKKGKEKKKKKRRRSIDPDSIQSALLASGLGSTRPAFTAPVNPPSTPAIGEHVATRHSSITTLWLNRLRVNECRVFTCSKVKAESQDSYVTGDDAVEHAQKMKRELLDQLEEVAEELPPNTLDELIDELGGPENVAEVMKTYSCLAF